MSVKRILYSLVLYLIFPFVIFRLFWRSRSNPAYRQRIYERLGFVKNNSDKPVIWLHAVSVGETIAAKSLIEGLISQYPEHQILVTTTTPTGSDRVKALFKDRVAHVYFPYDLPGIIQRFLKRIKPHALIIIETEIWPNLFAGCHKRDVPIFIVNARLSAKSTQAYLKFKGLITETLSYADKIAVRSNDDKKHFLQLGAKESQIEVVGNIKFDFLIDNQLVTKGKKWKKQWGADRLVWVVASTHEGEDDKILRIYSDLLNVVPELLLVLVPRHPERFDAVYDQCKKFKVQRHSLISENDGYKHFDGNIILGDSMGEMQSWFAVADVVFIGGSLVNTGGHNPLEAIAHGKPVVSGQYMFNFNDMLVELKIAGLLFSSKLEEDITKKLSDLLELPRNSFVGKTQTIMQKNKGATARLLGLIKALI
ncbi:MAG: lipid IV(A) 3-deoxy-D-manno-octulosonic acid transferase [Cocleimonas sp.]